MFVRRKRILRWCDLLRDARPVTFWGQSTSALSRAVRMWAPCLPYSADFLSGLQSNRIVSPYGKRLNFHFMMFQVFSDLYVSIYLFLIDFRYVFQPAWPSWGIVQPCESNSWAIGSTSVMTLCLLWQLLEKLWPWMAQDMARKQLHRWWHPQCVWARLLAWGPQVFCTKLPRHTQNFAGNSWSLVVGRTSVWIALNWASVKRACSSVILHGLEQRGGFYLVYVPRS